MITLVNNTGLDLRVAGIDKEILNSIEAGVELPEEIADLISLKVIEIAGNKRGIVEMI